MAWEWLASGLSFVYVVLAARNSAWCWPFAFVGSLIWAFQVWFAYGLLFDMLLNVFYAGMAVVGLWQWTRSARSEDRADANVTAHPIKETPIKVHALVIGGGATVSLVFYVLAKAYTSAEMAGPDAVTTVFSVLATFLLIDRRLENWLYFIAVDVAYVWIYLDRGSLVFAATFAVYTVMAVVGYRRWRGQLRLSPKPAPGGVPGRG